jgi:hypothetical protein
VKAGLTLAVLLLCAAPAFAQGGPPLLTTDPDTPGPENFELNFGVMPVLRQGSGGPGKGSVQIQNVQIPQFDLNYGIGERIQLTYEVPYIWQAGTGQPTVTGWSNGFIGVKWRFYEQSEDGWKISTFPQLQTSGPDGAVGKGIATNGTRLLLPIEVSRKFGPIHANFEFGYYIPVGNPPSHNERFFGLAFGHNFTPKLEVIGEVFNDYVMGAPPKDTVFDAGARYTLHRSFILLFMAGRSFSPNNSGQPTFISYAGIQVLLDKNGRSFHVEK